MFISSFLLFKTKDVVLDIKASFIMFTKHHEIQDIVRKCTNKTRGNGISGFTFMSQINEGFKKILKK